MILPVAGGIQETPPAQLVSATSELGAQLMAQPQEQWELLPSCLLIFSWNACIPALLNHAPRHPLPTRTHRHVSDSFKISPSPQTAPCCAGTVSGRCIQSPSIGLGNTARLSCFTPGLFYPSDLGREKNFLKLGLCFRAS